MKNALLKAKALFVAVVGSPTDEDGERGNMGLLMAVVMAFVAVYVVYYMVPELITANQVVQTDENASDMTKMAANLGEWLMPIGGIVAK